MEAPWLEFCADTRPRQHLQASGIPYARSRQAAKAVISALRDGYCALREAIISISTFAPIGSAATANVERAG